MHHDEALQSILKYFTSFKDFPLSLSSGEPFIAGKLVAAENCALAKTSAVPRAWPWETLKLNEREMPWRKPYRERAAQQKASGQLHSNP